MASFRGHPVSKAMTECGAQGSNKMTTAKHFAELIAARLHQEIEQSRASWLALPKDRARHVIIDRLLPDDLAQAIAADFPKSGDFWRQLNSFRERKKTFAKLDALDSTIANITDAFHQPNVLEAIETLTGMVDLEADPSLYAGGISLMQQGDFLNPHIDNSHDGERHRYRRLNLLYYVSPSWVATNGGNLELWDKNVIEPLEITSKFNRLVVMETNKTSWHSVNPVTADASRCCVSNYYFSKTSPDGSDYHHITSFLGRPDQTMRRFFGRIDNFGRQLVASTLGVTRGKHLGRGIK